MLSRTPKHWLAGLCAALLTLPAAGQSLGLPSARKPVVTPTPITVAEPLDVIEHPERKTFKLSLSKLHGDRAPVNLTSVSDTLDIPLPVPGLWQPEAVNLRLKLTPSQALIKGSQLVVHLNGNVVAQHPLHGRNEPLELDIALPVKRLTKGFNQVSLQVSQHYTDICEYPEAPQLWSQVSMTDSAFTIDASPRAPAPQLRNIDSLFDRATWDPKVEVPVFAAADPSDTRLRSLGLTAQGVGQRFDFVPVVLSHQALPRNLTELVAAMPEHSRTAVVIGTFDEIAALDPTSTYPKDAGPVIAVRQLPGDLPRYGLLLMGASEEDLVSAASAFATLRVPWPDADWVAINQVKIPTPTNLEQRFAIPTLAKGAFPLRALGYITTTYRGLDSPSATLKLWNNSWQGRMQVRVHLSYASGMSPQSSLAVLTNGVMHAQIPLSNPEGGVYENYAVTIPAGAMRPGWNTLELKPYLLPQQAGGHCQPWFYDNLGVTVYEDTTIQKFGGSEFRQTDLSLISNQGQLFTEQPMGRNIAFNLAAKDADTLSAGMTLLAKMSQIYDRPLLNAHFGVAANEEANQHYWVGAWEQLPEALRNRASSSIPDSVDFRVPVIQSSTVRVYEGWDWFTNTLEELNIIRTPPADTTEVDIQLNGVFQNKNFAISTTNDEDEPVMLFTAINSAQLRQGVTSVVDYGLWAQLRGVLAYWSTGGKRVSAVTVGDTPFSAFGLRGGLGLWVSQRPWISLFILLAVVTLLIVLTRKVLRRYQTHKKHMEEA